MLNQSLLFTALLAGVAGGGHCIGMCGSIATLLSSGMDKTERQATFPRFSSPAASSGLTGKTIPVIAIKSAAASSWYTIFMLHFGRLMLYAILGAVVGLFGTAGILLKPIVPVQSFLFYMGNFSLLYLGCRCLGFAPVLGLESVRQRMVSWLSSCTARVVAPLRHSRPILRMTSLMGTVAGGRYSLAAVAVHPFTKGLIWGCMPCGLVYGVLPLALISGAAWSGAVLMLRFGLGALPYLLLTHGLAHRFARRKAAGWLAMVAACLLIAAGITGLLLPHDHHSMAWWC